MSVEADTNNPTIQKIISQLEEAYDPEIPINIYDLGLIYKIKLPTQNTCYILMTLTSPTCPTAEYLQAMVEESALSVDEIDECEVELTFEPKWTPEMVSLEVREEMGIAVKDENSQAPEHVKESIAQHEDLQLQETFKETDSITKNEGVKLCFNCSITEDKLPLLSGVYKGKNIYICTRCISKF